MRETCSQLDDFVSPGVETLIKPSSFCIHCVFLGGDATRCCCRASGNAYEYSTVRQSVTTYIQHGGCHLERHQRPASVINSFMQNALDADIDRAASIVDGDMICVTVIDHDEEKRLTVDPGRLSTMRSLRRLDARGRSRCSGCCLATWTCSRGRALNSTVSRWPLLAAQRCCLALLFTAAHLWICAFCVCVGPPPGWGEAQCKHQDAESECRRSGHRNCGTQPCRCS